MAKEKFVVKKPPSRPFPLKLVLFSIITRERVGETRDSETQRGIRARTHTHTQRERERRCVIARFVRVTREREIDAFFFLPCDERTYPNESEEGGIEKDDVAASFRVVFDDFDFGWFVHK